MTRGRESLGLKSQSGLQCHLLLAQKRLSVGDADPGLSAQLNRLERLSQMATTWGVAKSQPCTE